MVVRIAGITKSVNAGLASEDSVMSVGMYLGLDWESCSLSYSLTRIIVQKLKIMLWS